MLNNRHSATVTQTTTASAPTAATDGVLIRNAPRYVRLQADTSGSVGSVAFEVWHYVPGGSVPWTFDRSLGANGVITISAITDAPYDIVFEAPGSRVMIRTITNAAGTTLTVDVIEITEN